MRQAALAVVATMVSGVNTAMSETKQGPDWVCVNQKADWQARDSMGEFVYQDQLWILGGWFDAKQPNPLDVWKSPDGKQWTCVQEHAPWVQSDLPVSLIYKGKMWIMGGRKLPGTECSNKVWSSTDGVAWTLEAEHAGWCARVSPAFVVFKDRMWVLGGTESFYDHSDAMVKNDVWSSADGKDWKLETPNAGWSKRAHAQAVVFDNKIWIMGGGLWHPEHVAVNDVWCSENGEHWTQVTASAAWAPRLWFSTVVYRDRIWVLGGWSKPNGNFGDVWYSKDGKDWTELKSNVIWKNRHEHSVVVFQDKLWLYGGYADVLSSEVWTLEVPPGWFGDE
ncbi:MAG: galactose oxidase [Lentisphaerae bacterium RIFOXYB12_FULL_65_16]|nr:MAG: galactose oxidase [Lentisphaerae bacterium RIFOXYA12_64_32]OGV93230.1 MAG: galactose oxidase [Lentisphaerae bacterium RIFOXYB12_FULL_65_16]